MNPANLTSKGSGCPYLDGLVQEYVKAQAAKQLETSTCKYLNNLMQEECTGAQSAIQSEISACHRLNDLIQEHLKTKPSKMSGVGHELCSEPGSETTVCGTPDNTLFTTPNFDATSSISSSPAPSLATADDGESTPSSPDTVYSSTIELEAPCSENQAETVDEMDISEKFRVLINDMRLPPSKLVDKPLVFSSTPVEMISSTIASPIKLSPDIASAKPTITNPIFEVISNTITSPIKASPIIPYTKLIITYPNFEVISSPIASPIKVSPITRSTKAIITNPTFGRHKVPLKFIDSTASISELIDKLTFITLSQQPELYISTTGKPSISILAIYHFNKCVYLLDIHNLKMAAFTTPGIQSADKTLKTMLECPDYRKGFFNIGAHSEVLFSQYGIKLAGVVDIQLMEYATRTTKCKTFRNPVSSLGGCITLDKGSQISKAEKTAWRKNKTAWASLFCKPGYWDLFHERPLRMEIAEYCVLDVLFLGDLWGFYERFLTEDMKGNVERWMGERLMKSWKQGVSVQEVVEKSIENPGLLEKNTVLEEKEIPNEKATVNEEEFPTEGESPKEEELKNKTRTEGESSKKKEIPKEKATPKEEEPPKVKESPTEGESKDDKTPKEGDSSKQENPQPPKEEEQATPTKVQPTIETPSTIKQDPAGLSTTTEKQSNPLQDEKENTRPLWSSGNILSLWALGW